MTMRAIVASVALSTAAGVLLATSVLAAPGTKLTPSDIQSTFFNGQPFNASTPSNVRYKMTFTADGKMKREPMGPGNKGEGTWKLSKDGFCTTWNGAKPNCFTVASVSDNQWSVLRGTTVVATWTK